MVIRKATKEDADKITEHLFLAMADFLYQLIGKDSPLQAKKLLRYFVQRENNQYSYQNCFVAETKHGVVGTINIYDGSRLDVLRQPILQYIENQFSYNIKPEDETHIGEYYIDSFGVDPDSQGAGIGTKILKRIIEKYSSKKETLGLLVDVDNPKAEKLYLSLGFEVVGTKRLTGKRMKHLQKKPD